MTQPIMSGQRRHPALGVLSALSLLALASAVPVGAQQSITENDLAAFSARDIGPTVTGGRIHDVEAVPGDPSTIYVASASGGLWKSSNRGISWTNLWEHMPVSSFGDIAIAPSDSEVVYAGTGGQQNRQSSSWGNGIYRTTDGGSSWTHLGLDNTRHIARVRIHPTNPDIVFAAAVGNLWASSEERGVYRSTDGGSSWDRVLFVDQHTGAIDLVIDSNNPEILYAAMYQRQRKAFGFNGGGPGSGIYKSTDGGDSWSELTNGIPSGDKGRIGLAIAASNPNVLNALIQHGTESGGYRSDDAGESWEKVSSQNSRPMYYSHIFIDPTNEDRVYTLATSTLKSEDGGRTFVEIAKRPTYDIGVHADQHSYWIDPRNPDHAYLGGDAGLHETYDGGVTFRRIHNIPIGQFYAIGVDMADPYYVYGGMQDNHSWMGPSRNRSWEGIAGDEWLQIGYGDGMFQQIDPRDNRTIYSNGQSGAWTRVDGVTGDMKSLSLRPPEGEEPYRWDWASPSLLSRHNPDVLYLGGNRLFTSRDMGNSFTRTEDLTRQQDREQMEIMGMKLEDVSISKNDGVGSFGSITTIAESPLTADVLWIGTDDGNVKVSQDGGRTWNEVSGAITGVRNGTYVSRLVASAAGTGAAYATFDAHRDGDFAPYVFRTDDFGLSWTALHGGLPSGSVNVMLEHPDNTDVLFVGTEHFFFASTDAGQTWVTFPDLPTTSYDDAVIHPREKDLVLGTHGRSIIIVDDIGPLADFASAAMAGASLFPVRPGTLLNYWKNTSYRADDTFMGENPVDGTLVTYRLGSGSGNATLAIRNGEGRLVRSLRVPSGAGLQRINWDLRHGIEQNETWAAHDPSVTVRPLQTRGPFVSPGIYTLELSARGETSTQTMVVKGDPDMDLSAEQYKTREAFLLELLSLGTTLDSSGDEAASGLRRRVRSLYGALNGGSVRQGTLYPPTQTQLDELGAVKEMMEGRGIG